MIDAARLVAVATVAALTVAGGASAGPRPPRGDSAIVEHTVQQEAGSLVQVSSRSRQAGRGRTQCFNPFPNFAPPNSGTCFLNTDIGAFFNLDDGIDYLFVETFGDNDDVLRYGPEPDRPLSTHQSSN